MESRVFEDNKKVLGKNTVENATVIRNDSSF